MEFNYFLNQLPIESSDLLFSAIYPGLDYTANVSEPYSGETIEGSYELDSFTVILTFERNQLGAKVLLSSKDSGEGWVFGITDSNFLFFEKNKNTVESFLFDNINLGKKNCIAIIKNYNSISVCKYDIVSNDIESFQSFLLTDTAETLNEITICGNSEDYTGPLLPFDGVIDQFALFSEPYDASYLLGIFSGFAPYTLSSSTGVSFNLVDTNSYFVNEPVSYDNSYLYSYTTGLNNYIINNLSTGDYIISIDGTIDSTTNVTSNIYTGVSLCEGSGLDSSFIYSSLIAPTGAFLGAQGVSGVARVTVSSSTIYIGYDISFTGSYLNNCNAFYNYYYNYSSTTGHVLTYDYSYETGFLLNGVTSEFADLIILGSGSGTDPTGYNQVAYLDTIASKFYAPNLSSNRTIYYNGSRLGNDDYSYADNHIDLSSASEQPGDYLIYDNDININLGFLGVENYATGDFYPNSSVVFTGHVSYTGVKRDLSYNYLETSTYHMYHACKIQKRGNSLLFSI